MATTEAPKRPRIDNVHLNAIADMYPGEPFERAVNRALTEAIDVRGMLAEMILDLEGPRPNGEGFKEFIARRNEIAIEHNAIGLVRILKLRLRDRDIEL